MKNEPTLKLTKVQREVLESVRDGLMITIDRMNMPWIGDRCLSPQTRYFLTQNRLVERQDKTKAVEAQGNGFVLSPKGVAVLQALDTTSKSTVCGYSAAPKQKTPEPATECQVAYARYLGISVPSDANKEEVSDLIDAKLHNDKLPSLSLQAFAKSQGVPFTQYTGKKSLFERIFARFSRPGREEDLAAWFVYRVYRELVRGAADAPIQSPDDAVIRTIAKQCVLESSLIKSILRYQGRELVWFGQWTAPDGTIHQGGSNRSVAYKHAASLLKEQGVA